MNISRLTLWVMGIRMHAFATSLSPSPQLSRSTQTVACLGAEGVEGKGSVNETFQWSVSTRTT
jgi:hypothetical protein